MIEVEGRTSISANYMSLASISLPPESRCIIGHSGQRNYVVRCNHTLEEASRAASVSTRNCNIATSRRRFRAHSNRASPPCARRSGMVFQHIQPVPAPELSSATSSKRRYMLRADQRPRQRGAAWNADVSRTGREGRQFPRNSRAASKRAAIARALDGPEGHDVRRTTSALDPD